MLLHLDEYRLSARARRGQVTCPQDKPVDSP